MTDAKRKTKILLLQQNMTFAQLAKTAGLALATVHNVLDGKASSRKSKQAITNALGASIFEGMEPTETHHVFRKGTTVEFVGSPELAAQWRDECKGKVRVRGCNVTFLDDIPVTFLFTDPSTENLSGARSKRTHRKKTSAS
jgi:lambda repressor-like predicted transcriptional regulator